MKHPRSLVIGKMKTNFVSFTVQRAKRWTLMLFSNQQEQLTRGPGVFMALELFKPKLEWSVCKPYNPRHSWNKLASLSKGITSGWRAHMARNTHSKCLFQSVVSEPFQTFSLSHLTTIIVATWLVPTKLNRQTIFSLRYIPSTKIYLQWMTKLLNVFPISHLYSNYLVFPPFCPTKMYFPNISIPCRIKFTIW